MTWVLALGKLGLKIYIYFGVKKIRLVKPILPHNFKPESEYLQALSPVKNKHLTQDSDHIIANFCDLNFDILNLEQLPLIMLN